MCYAVLVSSICNGPIWWCYVGFIGHNYTCIPALLFVCMHICVFIVICIEVNFVAWQCPLWCPSVLFDPAFHYAKCYYSEASSNSTLVSTAGGYHFQTIVFSYIVTSNHIEHGFRQVFGRLPGRDAGLKCGFCWPSIGGESGGSPRGC